MLRSKKQNDMKKGVKIASITFVIFTMLTTIYVSILTMINPQATMNLVDVQLTNTDAMSSIRGVFGGVGITIVVLLLFFITSDVKKGVSFLVIFWGMYALSRLITIVIDGGLGDFGTQWLQIESVMFVIAIVLMLLNKKYLSSESN